MIEKYQLETVQASDLVFDPENPNVMTEEDEKGLVKSLNLFGDVYPITIDQNNLILNGNHRAKKLIEMGETEIQVFRRNFKDDTERRLFSQTMNKLHGTYDPIKDHTQLLKIMNDGSLDTLAELIAQPKDELTKLLETESDQKLDQLLNSGGSLEYLTLEFNFDNDIREYITNMLAFLKTHFKSRTNGEVFYNLCREFEANHKDEIAIPENNQ